MPDFSIGFQIGVELTKAFGTPAVQAAVQPAIDKVLTLARNYRLSGSDILVEYDLADVFGRSKIEPMLERRFRTEVLKSVEINPIQQGSVLALSTGAGTTLTEAKSNEGLMSTVIQLSFLGSVHGRTGLASTLDDCWNSRFEMKIPGSRPSPGISGIVRVLESCSSQTSIFDWSFYFELVRSRLQALSMIPARSPDGSLRLSPIVLRACLEFFCIVQRTPEERFMIVNEPEGLLTLIVWAHFLHGLSVLVVDQSSQKRVGFPDDHHRNPSIIIQFSGGYRKHPTVSILDSSKEELIRLEPDGNDVGSLLEARERLKLRGYGTIVLCRHLNQSLDLFLLEPDHPTLVEGAQFTIAMARLISQRLRRVSGSQNGASDKCSIDRRRIYEAARVYFAHPFHPNINERVRYEEDKTEQYLDMMEVARSWKDASLPKVFQLEEYKDADGSYQFSSITFLDLAVNLLCISAIIGIDNCAEMKLVLEDNFEERCDFGNRVSSMKDFIPYHSHDLLACIARLMVGRDLALTASVDGGSGDGACFMVSDFGWTVSLPTYGDSDPSTITLDSLIIGKGVPKNFRTKEQKNRVRDALPLGIQITGNSRQGIEWIRDRGKQTYDPRCISPVHDRTEFYGSRDNEFHLAVKFRGQHIEHMDGLGEPYWFEVNQSPRAFYEGLWNTVTAPPCPHRKNGYDDGMCSEGQLGLGVATAGGVWSWSDQEIGRKGKPVPEKVVVVLVKGDRRARWLAVGNTVGRKQSRATMLRGKNSCENCAVVAASARPGNWFVII